MTLMLQNAGYSINMLLEEINHSSDDPAVSSSDKTIWVTKVTFHHMISCNIPIL